MGPKVLVVDDEIKIRDLITKYLLSEGFDVLTASDGPSGLQKALSQPIDLVVLDVMLPGLDGFEVLKALRVQRDVPVIMLTARTEEIDTLLGLGLGADDYITKPFSLKELAFRIRAVLRRSKAQREPVTWRTVKHGNVVIDLDGRQVTVEGKPIELTRTEFELFKALMSTPGRVFTRDQLMRAVSGDPYEGYERSIDAHVSNLRKKIEKDPSNPTYILTVYGVGYKGGP